MSFSFPLIPSQRRNSAPMYDEPKMQGLSQRDYACTVSSLCESLDSVGDITLIQSQVVPEVSGHSVRVRHRASIELDGRSHGLRYSEPVVSITTPSEDTIIMYPGFGEDPNTGTARAFHDAVASQYPYLRTISISTDGLGADDTPLSWKDALTTTFEDMAETRLDLEQALVGDDRVTLVTMSMGSVIALHAVSSNFKSQKVNHRQAILTKPAIVSPQEAQKVFSGDFLKHVYQDTVREIIFHPFDVVRSATASSLYDPKRSPQVYLGNIRNLFRGTDPTLLEHVASQSLVDVIIAGQDPLGQRSMYENLADKHPDNVHVLVKEGHGHTMLNPTNTREIAKDVRTLVGPLGETATSWL